MGWWQAKKTIVKRVGDLELVFYNKETIYAREGGGAWVVFHRWGEPWGFYNSHWRPFRHLLLAETTINLEHCFRLAERYEIQTHTTTRAPDLRGREIDKRIFNKEKEL